MRWVENKLIKHPDFALPGRKVLLKSDSEYEVVLIDAAETRIERPKKSKNIFTQGRKKRHTLKSQIVVDKRSKKIICTAFSNVKRHDFRLFKESKTHIHPKIKALTDTGYQGLKKIHGKADLPRKKTKKQPLSKEDKKINRKISSERVLNEQVIGRLKRFKIISDRYRSRRKRFGLIFNLISAIYNLEINS